MNAKIILLLAVAAVALGTASIVQWQKAARQSSHIAALQNERRELEQQIAALQLAKDHADERQRGLLHQLSPLASEPAPPRVEDQALQPDDPASSSPQKTAAQEGGGFGKFISQLMEDPDTKKLIRQQQRIMLDQLYGPLIKQMGLNQEEAGQFKELLSDEMMKGTERASALFGGTEADRKELVNKLAEEQKSSEAKLREFLGDGLYAQYKDYQQTIAERTQLNMFRQQSADSPHQLSEAQAEQLLLLMSEEKRSVASSVGQQLPGLDQNAALEAALSEDRTEAMLRAQEEVNQRVLERAAALLKPEQLQGFEQFQNNQLQMMRMGMSMARKLIGPDGSPSGSGPVP
jgi:hypothetical protein